MSVKGRVVIEVMEDGSARYVPDPALSRLEANAAVLEAWRLVIGLVDLAWYRTIRREEEQAEAAAAGREQAGEP